MGRGATAGFRDSKCDTLSFRIVLSPLHMLATTLRLTHLPTGAHATVACVSANSPDASAATLERLGELGFIAGEPVQLLQRGPGGREPLAVVVGETMFALRWLEADCIEVSPT